MSTAATLGAAPDEWEARDALKPYDIAVDMLAEAGVVLVVGAVGSSVLWGLREMTALEAAVR